MDDLTSLPGTFELLLLVAFALLGLRLALTLPDALRSGCVGSIERSEEPLVYWGDIAFRVLIGPVAALLIALGLAEYAPVLFSAVTALIFARLLVRVVAIGELGFGGVTRPTHPVAFWVFCFMILLMATSGLASMLEKLGYL